MSSAEKIAELNERSNTVCPKSSTMVKYLVKYSLKNVLYKNCRVLSDALNSSISMIPGGVATVR